MRHKKYRKMFADETENNRNADGLDTPFDIIAEAYKIINHREENIELAYAPKKTFKRKLTVFLKAFWF